MRPKFVKTTNVLTLERSVSALRKRGANEACLVVVDGVPGLGKTTTLSRFATQNASVYLRAKKQWTPSWFMKELLKELRLEPPHSFDQKFELALKTLVQKQVAADNAEKVFALIVDEADHISSNGRLMETIRDLSDMIEMPTILVGMGKIRNNLVRFPQITSRISQYVEFEKATLADVHKFFEELCEVKVADDLVKFTCKATDGMNREIKEAIAVIERFGTLNPPSETGLTMRDMAGERLINDRRTGQSIFVPQVA